MSTLTTAPHSTDAERTVLGSLLLDPDAIHRVVSRLQPSDFFDPIYRTIYVAIQELYGEGTPIDFVTVNDKLSGNAKFQQIGGASFLAELPIEVPTVSHIEKYADILTDRSTRRQLLKLGKDVIALASDDEKQTVDLIETVEQELLSLSYATVQRKPHALGELCMERYEHYTEVHETDTPNYGIQTGFAALDHLIVGLRPGDMFVLGGRPSMGKTAIALEMARHAASEQNKKVAIFSLEMNKEQLFDRLFAAFHGVDEYQLSRGELSEPNMQRMGETFDAIGKLPLFIDDDPDKSITNLRSKARRHKMEHGLDLLIIDYLQLIQVPTFINRENRNEQLRFISESIKALAREIDAPIIALSQLNREADKRIDKRPQLSDLRESGAIEQDADYAVLLYRDAYYDEDCDEPLITDLYLRKNRPHGQTGHVEVRFDPTRQCFESV